MIDDGLPRNRSDWPGGVLEALRRFRQGDVVPAPPIFYFAEPQRAIWAWTARYVDDAVGSEVVVGSVNVSPPYAIITTHTCDIAEEDADQPLRPWAQIAPVYEGSVVFNSGQQRLLRQGGFRQYLLHLPGLVDGFWVADLRIEMPVEKGWLAGQARFEGFSTEKERRLVGDRLAVLRRRPALGRNFVRSVHDPLLKALRELKNSDSKLFERLDSQVVEVGVYLDSLLEPQEAQLVFLSEVELDPDVRGWFEDWRDGRLPEVQRCGITFHALDFLPFGSLTAAQYRALTILPLIRLSPAQGHK